MRINIYPLVNLFVSSIYINGNVVHNIFITCLYRFSFLISFSVPLVYIALAFESLPKRHKYDGNYFLQIRIACTSGKATLHCRSDWV